MRNIIKKFINWIKYKFSKPAPIPFAFVIQEAMGDSLEEEIKSSIRSIVGIDRNVEISGKHFTDFNLDSLDAIEIIMHLEDKYNILIEDTGNSNETKCFFTYRNFDSLIKEVANRVKNKTEAV